MQEINQILPIKYLHAHPGNPRKELGDISELTESIRAKGVLQPLTVLPELDEQGDITGDSYTVLIGHRRMAAAKAAGETKVPCVILLEEVNEKEQLEIMLMENIQRSNLTVYEEAQGFQQLLDFGADIDEICAKSGFSESTVRRRLEIAKLDKEKVQQAQVRQPSLSDYAKLAQIESIEKRNELLDDIGTNNFNLSLSIAIREQNHEKLVKPIEEELKQAGFKKLPESQRYTSEWQMTQYIRLKEWADDKKQLPKNNVDGYKYWIDEGNVYLYRKLEKKKEVAPSPEEQKKEKVKLRKWAELDKLSESCYNLRKEFIDNFTFTKSKAQDVLMGALYAGIYNNANYVSGDRKAIYSLLGIDNENPYSAEAQKQKENIGKDTSWAAGDRIPKLIYAMFGDSKNLFCAQDYRLKAPAFQENPKLSLLYYWLSTIGYEMADEEKQLMCGTHTVFQEELDL